jgi:hypothetical protein
MKASSEGGLSHTLARPPEFWAPLSPSGKLAFGAQRGYAITQLMLEASQQTFHGGIQSSGNHLQCDQSHLTFAQLNI